MQTQVEAFGLRRLTFFRISLVACLLAGALVSPRTGNAAYFPGDCGKPTKALASQAGLPLSSDALYALRAAVGQSGSPCVKYICDTDGNGIVQASDALRILRRAVGLEVAFACPPCVDSDNTYCNCSETEFVNKLSEDPNFTNKPSNDVAALFGCAGFSTYSFNTTQWTTARREIEADDVWLHGAGVLVTPETPCYPNGQENNPVNNATNCPDSGSGANQLFMRITGDNVGVTGFTVKGFVDGLRFAGTNGTAGAMIFDRQCDDSVSNEQNLGIGNEVRNSTFRRGCDKCVEDAKGPNLAQPCSGRGCFHVAYYDSDFVGCAASIRFSSLADNGRFKLDTTTDRPLGTCSNSGALCSVNPDCGAGNSCNIVWACNGADMGSTGLETTMVGITSEGCTTGLSLGTGDHKLQGQSRIINSTERGVSLRGNAVATIRDTKIVNNGGASSTLPGGVVAIENSKPDLGKLDEDGLNCIYDNKKIGAGLEVNNRRPEYKLKAHANWWNNSGDPPHLSELPRLCTDLVTSCTVDDDCNGTETCNKVETNRSLTPASAPAFCSQ